MKKNERLVLFFDIEVTAESKHNLAPKPLSIREAFEILGKIPKENRVKYTSKNKEALYIPDIKQYDNKIVALINKSDTTVADPVLSNPKNNERRTIEKEPNEGQDYSSHILIITNDNDPSQALALIEHCQGLGISTIKYTLESIMKNAEQICPDKFTRNHPNGEIDQEGKSKKYNVKHSFIFKAHPSDAFKNDINNGTIRSIELIRDREKHSEFDEDSHFVEKYSTLCIKPADNKSLVGRGYVALKKLFSSKKDDYDRARIKFKTPEGMERSIEYDFYSPTSHEYIKKYRIDNFAEELKSSYDAIYNPIVEKMEALYDEPRDNKKPN